MGRGKTPAWQLFDYKTKQDDAGKWVARSHYNDEAGVRHDIKRSGRKKGAVDLAMRRGVEEAKLRSMQRDEEARRKREEEAKREKEAGPTLEELAERWLEYRKPAPVKIDEITQTGLPPTNEIRMQTWTSYANNLRRHVFPVLGKYPSAELKTPHLEEAIHRMYDKEKGTGYRTADMAKQVLSQIMDYAVRQGFRQDNPVRFVSNIPTPQKAPVRLKAATLAAVHEAVQVRLPEPGVGGPKPTSRLSDVVLFLQGTGMRIGEALAVRWDDISIDGDSIFVTVSGTLIEKDGKFFRQSHPKSSKSFRTLPLTTDWMQDMIRRRLRNKYPTRTNALFPTRNGTFYRLSNFRTDLKKAMKAGRISEKITPHTFRSTVGSQIAEMFDDEAAQKQLGHSSPETTRRYYIQRPDVVPDYSLSFERMTSAAKRD